MKVEMIKRLEDEKKELEIKSDKLNDFIEDNPEFENVNDIQRILLVNQFNGMQIYLFALEERIYYLENQK